MEATLSVAKWGPYSKSCFRHLVRSNVSPGQAAADTVHRNINKEIGVDFDKDEGIAIVDKWAMYLRNLDVQCANLQWETPRIIDFECVKNVDS